MTCAIFTLCVSIDTNVVQYIKNSWYAFNDSSYCVLGPIICTTYSEPASLVHLRSNVSSECGYVSTFFIKL